MIVEPVVITGKKTPPAKLAARDTAITAAKAGKAIARNSRTIARERRKKPPTAAPGDLSGDALQQRQDELRSWRRANAQWFEAMSPGEQDCLLATFWRYARGEISWRAFRAEASTARIGVEGLPEPPELQQARYHAAVLRWARLCDNPPSGGW